MKPPSTLQPEATPEVERPSGFPDRPITLLVGSTKGAEADIAARTVIPRLEKGLGRPVVVVDRLGGGGLDAWSELKQAKPDGYTLGLIASPQFQLMALDPRTKAPFAIGDFVPAANQLWDPVAILVRSGSGLQSLRELIAAARSQPEGISISVPATGAAERLAITDLQRKVGLKLRVTEFIDATNARLAALSGQVEAVCGRYSYLAPLARSRQGRFLIFLEEKRLPEWPEVPTLKEMGVDVLFPSSLGYAVPKGTPQEVVDYMAWALHLAMSAPEPQAALRESGLGMRFMGPEQYASFLADQAERTRELLPTLLLKPSS